MYIDNIYTNIWFIYIYTYGLYIYIHMVYIYIWFIYIYMIDVVHPCALGAIKFEPWIRRSPKKGLQVSREIHVFCTKRSSTCLIQLVVCFLKWWYLTTRVFLLKMIILGCFGGSTILGNPQFDLSITDQFQRNSHHLCSQVFAHAILHVGHWG